MDRIVTFLEIALSLHATASLICAMTPTKQDDKILRRIYPWLEVIALNIGRAKDRK